MPRSSPVDGACVLIAAISGRALATAARRAGLKPLVADFFADADTCRISHACLKLGGTLGDGMQWTSLAPALEALAAKAPSPLLGLVYGSGFEDRPDLLAKLGGHWPLLGTGPCEVERVKAPEAFFAMLARLGVPHPRTVLAPPAGRKGWLAKRQGGAGGSHVAAALRGGVGARGKRIYFQERVEGRSVSALFVGNGCRARVLGFSEQWTAPRRGARWRYGGAVRPAELSIELEQQMSEVVERVAAAFALKGLGSADFLVRDRENIKDQALLLEINPRPGATLDIFDSEADPLLRLHLEAVLESRLPTAPRELPEASAAAIVYAAEPLIVPGTMVWPEWTADQPKCAERIDKSRPICTVLARGETKSEAKRLVEERISMILAACADEKGGTQ